jgi:ABC-type nitrate/sulfonate/bicarbonate transport system permease component
MFIALIGLGALLSRYGGRFDVGKVLGILIHIVAVALVGAGVVQVIDRRVTHWCD